MKVVWHTLPVLIGVFVMIPKEFISDLCKAVIEAEKQAKANPDVPGTALAVPMVKMANQILGLVNKDGVFFLEAIAEIETRLVNIERRLDKLEEKLNG